MNNTKVHPQTILTITLITLITLTIALIALIALAGWAYAKATEPAAPKQSIGTETVRMGDVKRYCIVVRTGAHIDAIDCNLIDPTTGEVL